MRAGGFASLLRGPYTRGGALVLDESMQDVLLQALIQPGIPLEPRRGLLPVHNAAGKDFRLTDLHRAMVLAARSLQVLKLDLLVLDELSSEKIQNCLDFARGLNLPLSLRTNGAFPVPGLAGAGWFDLHLAGSAEDATRWQPWMEAAHEAGLDIRVTLAGPLPVVPQPEHWAKLCVRSVTLRAGDLLIKSERRTEDPGSFQQALRAAGIDCVVLDGEDANFADHQQYDHAAFGFGLSLWKASPRQAQAMLMLRSIERAGFQSKADRWLTYALRMYAPALFPVVSAASRMVRFGRSARGDARPTPDALAATVGRASPRAEDPNPQPRYFDAIDRDRLRGDAVLMELAEEARRLSADGAAARDFETSDWGFENAFHDPMPGVNQMYALLPGEKRSTRLPWLRAPFMATVTLGGGMAEYAGFAIGRHIRVVCPMVATSHQLSLYADAAGRYVLLRDGVPVRPSLLRGAGYTPARLPEAMHLQVAIIDPEESMGITAVRAWEGHAAPEVPPPAVSVVIFCARFSRRLQAALLCIAHQRGIALDDLEVVVGHVPGLDTAEDVLDSVQRAHPALRIVRVSFAEGMAKSKGFCINACLRAASAPLIALLDSDILLPPDFLARAVAASAAHGFIAPAGRALLDPTTTARILLGELRPWEGFEALADAAPAFRAEENPQGVPLGYCQVFRAEALHHLRYAEYDHFQSADFEFGEALTKHFGGAHRLADRVLHLDHEGRQWYGAQKQF
jgi:hypothetical protein